MLYTILASISCWTIGDLGAQWYEYRNRKRGCILASNQRENNSTIRKSREVDILRLTHASLFGLFSAPLLLGYQKVVIPRIFGRLQRAATPSLLALGVHQLVLTPTVLLAYFNCMTALRGGFHDTSFMHAHEEIGASRRYTVSSIQRYMMEDVLPLPLLSSWIAVAPMYGFFFLSYTRLWGKVLLGCSWVWWCGIVSFTQSSLLL